MEVKVDRVQAEAEFNGWLDFKRITPKKREDNKPYIEKIIEGIMYGILTIDSKTHEITHSLCFPVGKETKIEKLVYQPRISTDVFSDHLTGVNPDDGLGRVRAYMAGLTGVSKHIIAKLDSEDYLLGSQIAVFFMA